MGFWGHIRLVLLTAVLGAVNLHAASEAIAARDVHAWTEAGYLRYEHCEFKDAARAFTKALQYRPEDAGLHHWLGKSYAKMAEVASPLHASRDARRARVSLERAVGLAPRNQEYLRGLFDFYLTSPEWFGGGLGLAARLVDRVEPDDPAAQAFLRELVAVAHQEYRGSDWRLRQATLLPSNQIGRIVP